MGATATVLFFNIRYVKSFFGQICLFFGIDLGNIIINIAYYAFIPLKLSVFKRKPDKVS
jgi:hypothetical protein